MSIIADLGPNMENLPDLLSQFEEDLADYALNLAIKGKMLETTLKEQATWSAYYGERAVELGIISKYLDAQVKKVRAELVVRYNENYNPSLSERLMNSYIDREDAYLSINEIGLEVSELLDKYKMILEAFKNRGYALRNITEGRIADIHQVTL